MSTYTRLPEQMCQRLETRKRKSYRKQFNLTARQTKADFMDRALVDQLDRCADDAARRILLGVSK